VIVLVFIQLYHYEHVLIIYLFAAMCFPAKASFTRVTLFLVGVLFAKEFIALLPVM
jgi:hypothetical protein